MLVMVTVLPVRLGTLVGIVGRQRRGEAGEDALKDAKNELRRGRSGEEAWDDEEDVVAIAGRVGWKETTGCLQSARSLGSENCC